VHREQRATRSGQVRPRACFFFRRWLRALSYCTATEVTPQLPTGGDVSCFSPCEAWKVLMLPHVIGQTKVSEHELDDWMRPRFSVAAPRPYRQHISLVDIFVSGNGHQSVEREATL
jgi:hypothetical protein